MEISASSNEVTPFYVLIAAAGSSTRMGGDLPKQYMEICGKTVLRRSIEAFLSCPGLRELRVIIDPSHEALYKNAVRGLSLPAPIPGGDSRKSSVQKGLHQFPGINENDIILIHDAARPFVKRMHIESLISAAQHAGAAVLAVPVNDTLKKDRGEYVSRDQLYALQTPQAFRYGLIKGAHEQEGHYTDDTSLVAAIGHEIKLVPGSRKNFKITTMDDLEYAERLFPRIARTGTGFDVHAFTSGDKVRLCGIDIPHHYSLAGHSDADAALHAITDALLGAVAAGDIGHHFPPSNPQWKGCDSAVFLRKAVEIVHNHGGEIANIDVTIICETPKIGPHREKMQSRVAEICGISPYQVGIKGTTTEGLGFTGRGEGIAVQATASVIMVKT